MNQASIDRLGTLASQTAMRAFAEYIRAHKLKVVSYDAASECLRSHIKARLDMALAHAKEALDCGMAAAAEATFKADMAIAGIEAAKEAGFPLDYVP